MADTTFIYETALSDASYHTWYGLGLLFQVDLHAHYLVVCNFLIYVENIAISKINAHSNKLINYDAQYNFFIYLHLICHFFFSIFILIFGLMYFHVFLYAQFFGASITTFGVFKTSGIFLCYHTSLTDQIFLTIL